jgi:hypothetical protein
MPELKLARIPDRNPIKLTINVMPDIHAALAAYAAAYAAVYGKEEALADLVPAMVAAFLEGDRGFQKQQIGQRNA